MTNHLNMDTVIYVGDLFEGRPVKIRITNGDSPMISAIDFVAVVTMKDKNQSAEVIRGMQYEGNPKDKVLTDFFRSLQIHQFPGARQSAKYVLNASQAFVLMMMLHGKTAMAFRIASSQLLTRLFAGDPTLHALIEENGLLDNPMQVVLEHLKDVAPTVLASVKLGEGGESEAHYECKHWVAANINRIAFAAAVCPACSKPILGMTVAGGIAEVEQLVPGTNYRADVLVRLDKDTHVAIEVAHTHLISAKKMFECKEAGNIVYEVETKEIQKAIMEHEPFATHILFTTCTESILCTKCK
jgi:hypothetical protein